jgi:cysteine desulfurase
MLAIALQAERNPTQSYLFTYHEPHKEPMKSMSVYLDYNATAPVRAGVVEVMAEMLSQPFNPSSVHMLGRVARSKLEAARRVVADAVSAQPQEVIFTASATEANHMAFHGLAGMACTLVAATEHASVLRVARGDVRVIPVKSNGVLDMECYEQMLREAPRPALVSVMLANNETGVIQPIAEIASLARRYGGVMHCDGVQALGKIPVDCGVLGVDMLTISAHKCGGAVGAAALIARQGVAPQPLFLGGGQELRRRAGTENIAAICGFAKAIELMQGDVWQRPMRTALDEMERAMLHAVPSALVLGMDAPRLPNTSCVLLPEVSAETQLMHADIAGFCISAGAACSSGRMEHSHVAQAMGITEQAGGAVRISVGWNSHVQEILAYTECWLKLAARVKKAS